MRDEKRLLVGKRPQHEAGGLAQARLLEREAVIARAGLTSEKRLAAWGVRLDDPAAELARLAAEHGGSVFFPDFAHGALVAALTAMAGAAEEITE